MSLWLLNHHRLSTWRLGRTFFRDSCVFPHVLPDARGLVVGECPGPNTDPRMPLFPHPVKSAAGRMLEYSGITVADYLGLLERVNACSERWSDDEADARTQMTVKWLLDAANRVDGRPLRVLLLGRKVQHAWGVVNREEFGYTRWCDGDDMQITWAPHPSGTCRKYNDKTNREKLGRCVRWCAGLPV